MMMTAMSLKINGYSDAAHEFYDKITRIYPSFYDCRPALKYYNYIYIVEDPIVNTYDPQLWQTLRHIQTTIACAITSQRVQIDTILIL